MMGRCCGQTLSQAPQPMQSAALPRPSVIFLYSGCTFHLSSGLTLYSLYNLKYLGIQTRCGQPDTQYEQSVQGMAVCSRTIDAEQTRAVR